MWGINYPDQLWCPPNLLFGGYWGSFPAVKQSGYDVGYLLPSNDKLKNKQIFTSARSVYLHCMYWDNSTFYPQMNLKNVGFAV
jgi:hypothetical protein